MAVSFFIPFKPHAIDLYASNIGKIIKYINTKPSTEFEYDIINIFYYCLRFPT